MGYAGWMVEKNGCARVEMGGGFEEGDTRGGGVCGGADVGVWVLVLVWVGRVRGNFAGEMVRRIWIKKAKRGRKGLDKCHSRG